MNGTRLGSTIPLAKFKPLQADLIESGCKLQTGKPDGFNCPRCDSAHGVDMLYSCDGNGRGFVLCLSCWHVTKLLVQRGEES